jgi:hypothetical protein
MLRKTLLTILIAAFFAASASSYADTLIIEGIDSVNVDQRPRSGMMMETVASTWGAPITRRNAVGDPPITRWDYPAFVVYFEHDHVIHTVAIR